MGNKRAITATIGTAIALAAAHTNAAAGDKDGDVFRLDEVEKVNERCHALASSIEAGLEGNCGADGDCSGDYPCYHKRVVAELPGVCQRFVCELPPRPVAKGKSESPDPHPSAVCDPLWVKANDLVGCP